MRVSRRGLFSVLLTAVIALAMRPLGASADGPAGSRISNIISNVATLTYQSAAGDSFSAISNTATDYAIAGLGATITGPQGPGTLVDKRVDGTTFLQAAPGASVTYTIAFKNAGAVPAQNGVLSDTLPSGVLPDLASIRLDGNPVAATLQGNILKVPLGTLLPGAQHVVSFNATLTAGARQRSEPRERRDRVAADSAPATISLPAAIWLGRGNIVFDGYAGAAQPVAGATVALVDREDRASRVPLGGSTTQSNCAQPNATNANPFVSAAGGAYRLLASFPPNSVRRRSPRPIGSPIAAPGYLNRSISVTLTPDASGLLYSATLIALDGQPLAVAGGFTLTSGPVTSRTSPASSATSRSSRHPPCRSRRASIAPSPRPATGSFGRCNSKARRSRRSAPRA